MPFSFSQKIWNERFEMSLKFCALVDAFERRLLYGNFVKWYTVMTKHIMQTVNLNVNGETVAYGTQDMR